MARPYLRQLRAGVDFGRGSPAASQMQNFIYLVGDADAGRCVVVDPAWDIEAILAAAAEDGMTVEGALVTHYHPDHIGGSMFGIQVPGLPELMALNPCRVHAHKAELSGIRQMTGLEGSDVTAHDSGDVVRVGEIEIELLHTPGHTPGSQCFRLRQSLIAGDTLFLQGCGRTDLPGGDPEQMYYTLTQRLSSLPGDTVLYPGHAYGGDHAPMDAVRRTNPYLSVPDLATWMRFMG